MSKSFLKKGRKIVPLEIGDETIYLRELSLEQSAAVEGQTDGIDLTVKILISSIVEQDGKPTFTEADAAEIKKEMSLDQLNHILDAIRALNKWPSRDEAKKNLPNSPQTQPDNSNSN